MKKKARSIYLIIIDVVLINLAFYLAFLLRFEGNIPPGNFQGYMNNFFVITIIKVAVFYYFNLYKSLWKYASVEELMQIVIGAVVANTAVLSYLFIQQIHLPRSIYILVGLLDVFFIGGSRFSYRALRRLKNRDFKGKKNEKRVLIIGAGDAGAMVIKELKNHEELNSNPVAIIDDDESKEGQRINGIPVLGQRLDIASVSKKKRIDEIIIAIPSASKKEIKDIVNESKRTNCTLKILPGMFELIDEKVSINEIREVQIEDLLGRDQVELNIDEISGYLLGKRVLVTGGGGSIGSELCRQIARFNPERLIILDIYENNAYEIQNELKRKYNNLKLDVVIASVREKERMEDVFKKFSPEVVFHAAAHKHVPLMEDNPEEAIKNNVFGTLNVAQAADKEHVKRFVMISTDKAVNPTNIMGASKRICEMIVQSINKHSNTEFVAVRFGNVLGSNGSVIPLFKRQIKEGGPVTVTHKDVIRYFMTIPEASQLVIQAGAMAKGGEIFVLDMGEPVKIIDLARDLISFSGFEPNVDIPIEIVGLRPGEKLYEELLLDEEGIKSTKHKKIFIGEPIFSDYKVLLKSMDKFRDIINNEDEDKLRSYIKEIVPTYEKKNEKVNKRFEKECYEQISAAKE
ncbi:MAG: polysaccharide biosynthesis protein [Firmicutes bacterium]|nr:polysaccharide biosynthesis protein [Bacillota bacterium]